MFASVLPFAKKIPCSDNTTRSFEHVDGNWPSLVFAAIGETDFEIPKDEILQSYEWNQDMGAIGVHLSLSKPFVLRKHHISSFVKKLKHSLKGITPFTMRMTDASIFVNEDKSRSFLVFNGTKGRIKLIQVTKLIDVILREYKQEPYFDDPIPHFSIAHCVEDLSSLCDWSIKIQKPVSIQVNEISCQVGNQCFRIKLKNVENEGSRTMFDISSDDDSRTDSDDESDEDWVKDVEDKRENESKPDDDLFLF
eukprot:TRINITY_DN775850_c0_g1_i1.p1 TRINITY_DN775850_c0_g1~~TRINITY_DN775850_c0_g1_i1.p1  ORF type:complete len:251 (-),score=52.81 TRINITY_DN775850_c0_g1_i1:230-982(-)